MTHFADSAWYVYSLANIFRVFRNKKRSATALDVCCQGNGVLTSASADLVSVLWFVENVLPGGYDCHIHIGWGVNPLLPWWKPDGICLVFLRMSKMLKDRILLCSAKVLLEWKALWNKSGLVLIQRFHFKTETNKKILNLWQLLKRALWELFCHFYCRFLFFVTYLDDRISWPTKFSRLCRSDVLCCACLLFLLWS